MSRKRMGLDAQQRLFNSISRSMQAAAEKSAGIEATKKLLNDAIVELTQLHSAANPTPCPDQGPDTCPTWGAIYGLRNLLKALGT